MLLIAEIAVGGVAFAFRGEVEKLVDEYGPKLIEEANNAQKEGKEAPEGVMATWNLVQKKFVSEYCCSLCFELMAVDYTYYVYAGMLWSQGTQ